jgi:chemotaxis protein MotB
MRKLLVPVAVGVAMALMGISGCKVYSTTGQPDQTDEMERLRAENAELKARGTTGTARPPAPPKDLSPEDKKRLEKQGIPVTRDARGIKLTLPNKILFTSGSATLHAASKKGLDEVARVIKHQFAGDALIIRGHTDNQPIVHSANKFKSNEELSVARARAVAAALQKDGVKNRVKLEGLGDTQPLNENRTPDERAKNRRVEILIAAPGAVREKEAVPPPAPGPEAEE